jgi:hypothetical protein
MSSPGGFCPAALPWLLGKNHQDNSCSSRAGSGYNNVPMRAFHNSTPSQTCARTRRGERMRSGRPGGQSDHPDGSIGERDAPLDCRPGRLPAAASASPASAHPDATLWPCSDGMLVGELAPDSRKGQVLWMPPGRGSKPRSGGILPLFR